MTTKEYAEYEQSFSEFMTREGIANLSTIQAADGEATEPYFSWRRCECCNRPVGGDRYDANGYNPTSKEVCGPYSICEDCAYYAEYGQLDDMTMMDMRHDADTEVDNG